MTKYATNAKFEDIILHSAGARIASIIAATNMVVAWSVELEKLERGCVAQDIFSVDADAVRMMCAVHTEVSRLILLRTTC